ISMDLFDLSGEVAAVIGGTGVLGGAMAEGLAQAGARVSILGRNAERGTARAKHIQAAGGQANYVPADAQDRASLEKAVRAVEVSFGAPTILLNAAGGNDLKVTLGVGRKFEDVAVGDWKANFDLNVVGGILVPCQVFGPAMVQRG